MVRIWDADTLDPLFVLPAEPGAVNFVPFSPDGERLVSCNDDGFSGVWQTR